jgi:opacity protein-like surface antigen
MKRITATFSVWAYPLVGLLALMAASQARAEGFGGYEFSLRLPAALSRFSPYADVAGAGGACAASTWASSANPASADWRDAPGRLGLSFCPQYTAIPFQEGSVIHVANESLTWKDPHWGTFLPAMAQVRSNQAETLQGLGFDFYMDYFQMQWGKRIAENWAVGGNFYYSTSKVEFDAGPEAASLTDADCYNIRLGVVNQFLEQWRWGVVFDCGFTPSRTTLYDFLGSGIGNIEIHDVGSQYLLRPGIAFEYAKDSTIYCDYQLATFFDATGQLYINRCMLGIDHQVIKGFFVRSGVAVDDYGSAGWSAGVGVYPSQTFTIDLAYQYNMFPELYPDFRRSQTFALSLGLAF